MTAEKFCRILKEACGVLPGSHVLAAVSGGADSVALFCLLLQAKDMLGICVSCAHVEHGIRGEDSIKDMEFVRALCRQKNIAFYASHVDVPAYACQKGCGLEAAARDLRYAFLEKTRKEIGADVIACAHHSGDQAETVLMHAARGSDLRGLCAMRWISGHVIRPLLGVSAAQLRRYLTQMGQDWREDATNEDTEYTRNAIRHRVLPELERAYSGAGDALARLSRAAQRDEDFFAQQIAALNLRFVFLVNGAAVEQEAIGSLHEALLSRVLVRLMETAGAGPGGKEIDVLIRALRAREQTAMEIGNGFEARIGPKYLCVTKPHAEIETVPLAPLGETKTPFGTFFVSCAKAGETGDGVTRQIVPAKLLHGAIVTMRREGDVMIPFGQHTPVKVKKLMIDRGIERAMRSSLPVLRNGDEIFFIPGLRPSESCRVTENEERRMIVFCPARCDEHTTIEE